MPILFFTILQKVMANFPLGAILKSGEACLFGLLYIFHRLDEHKINHSPVSKDDEDRRKNTLQRQA
jgi:hypothetical protein